MSCCRQASEVCADTKVLSKLYGTALDYDGYLYIQLLLNLLRFKEVVFPFIVFKYNVFTLVCNVLTMI